VATLHQARWDLFLKVWKSNLDLKSQARQLLNPCLSILLLFFRNCGVFFLSLFFQDFLFLKLLNSAELLRDNWQNVFFCKTPTS
jgi:hypothetical protein